MSKEDAIRVTVVPVRDDKCFVPDYEFDLSLLEYRLAARGVDLGSEEAEVDD